ncbi:MauE/DoxX family redox-associated membrane protein [Pedobacter rhodius]|uniref:Methylamine utilisation protein MauE domain-containing protein n=1 Tax=Pedobacter rhodius TaxID=3004098 RepID=A0ABT4L0W7_9SPHI|nr:MauE/DoxX family redox-associated membrane protein [Pedobacter sp. SJ11]MCZ4224831.1 hypothetical protein [Pedobacter sp. SJ11]
MKTLVKSLIPILLVLLFTYAAFSKLVSFTDFRQQLYNQAFPHWLGSFLLYFLLPAEIITALFLCFNRTVLIGLLFSFGLLLAFTIYIALVVLHYWDRVPCSCGGILNQMDWTAHLIFNCFFLVLNFTVLYIHFLERRPAT